MTNTGHKDRADAIVEQIKRRARDGKDGRDAATLDDSQLRKALSDLQFRVEQLENKPTTLQPVNDTEAIPRAIGDLLQRIEEVEKTVISSEPAELKDEIDKLNQKVADFARAALNDSLEHMQRLDSMETRIKNMRGSLRKFFADEFEKLA
jgi:polyhydroxyalkanoate synthesis regulator phasin